jgi:hypothetical protein
MHMFVIRGRRHGFMFFMLVLALICAVLHCRPRPQGQMVEGQAIDNGSASVCLHIRCSGWRGNPHATGVRVVEPPLLEAVEDSCKLGRLERD